MGLTVPHFRQRFCVIRPTTFPTRRLSSAARHWQWVRQASGAVGRGRSASPYCARVVVHGLPSNSKRRLDGRGEVPGPVLRACN